MPWYIREVRYNTWNKYLVEAGSKESVERWDSEGEYIGYVDGHEGELRVFGPFATREEALANSESFVDG